MMRPLRLIEDHAMSRSKKTLKSFEELDKETREKFFEPKPLELVKPKGKQLGKVTVVEDFPEEEKKAAWRRAFAWFK